MEGKEYMSVAEMGEYLCVGKTMAYQLIHREGFPAVKITNKKYLIPKAALDKWANEQIVKGENK